MHDYIKPQLLSVRNVALNPEPSVMFHVLLTMTWQPKVPDIWDKEDQKTNKNYQEIYQLSKDFV